MSFTMKNLGKRISRQTRRTISAMLISGAMLSSTLVENSVAVAFDTHDSFFDEAPLEATSRTILKKRGIAVDAIERALASKEREPRVQLFAKRQSLLDDAIAKSLAGLTQTRTIVVPPIASIGAGPTESLQEPSMRLVGSSPIIVSIAEGYLPYDLISEEQHVALRSYPISIPQFRYLGGRRTMDQAVSDYGPLDCLGHGVVWSQNELPSRHVSIGNTQHANEQPSIWKTALEKLSRANDAISKVTSREMTKVDAKRRAIAIAINESIQPQSRLRELLAADRLGMQTGMSLTNIRKASQHQLNKMTQLIAKNVRFTKPKTRVELLEESVGERLLVRAGIEVDALDCATAGVADVVQDRVCCPVERCELAAQAPLTHQFAAVGVAAATLEKPLRPQAFVAEPVDQRIEGIAQAEALATACDNAAATLESVAMALRRAGDSIVRVAKATSAQAGTELR